METESVDKGRTQHLVDDTGFFVMGTLFSLIVEEADPKSCVFQNPPFRPNRL